MEKLGGNSWELLEIFGFGLGRVSSEFFFEGLFYLSLSGLLILDDQGLLEDFGLLIGIDFHFVVEVFDECDFEFGSGLGRDLGESLLRSCSSTANLLLLVFI
jgi:hypothetical protein